MFSNRHSPTYERIRDYHYLYLYIYIYMYIFYLVYKFMGHYYRTLAQIDMDVEIQGLCKKDNDINRLFLMFSTNHKEIV